jgi:hypothetical protein
MTEQENGIRKLKKEDVLKIVKADMKAADTLRMDIVKSVEDWKRQYSGEPYGNEEEGKSRLVSRDIKRQDEWQHASVKDPFVSDTDIIKCSPVTFEDRKAAEQNQLVLNYQFTRKFNRYKFITDALKLFYSEGTVIAKTSWEYEDQEVKEMVPVMAVDPMTGEPYVAEEVEVTNIKVLVNKPTADLCRLHDIFIDPTCFGYMEKARFIVHRYESDLSTLRASKKYKNLNKLSKSATDAENVDDYENTDDTNFIFTDEARKKILVHEYWGFLDMDGDGIAEPIVCTWVDDVIIQLQENPYPDKEIPFLMVTNNSTPFKIYGEAYAELIGDNQKISTAIKRGIMDNMANSNNAQKGIRRGALDSQNRKRFLNGKNFEFNGSTSDFYEGNYNQIPGSVFNVLDMVNNETESLLGVKAFAGGINGNAMGNTATSARGALDAVAVRRMDIVRNLSENLIKPMMRKWMAYNSEFLQEEEIIRITNEEFVPIKRDDLKGFVDIHIEVSTAEDNSSKAQELAFLLQTLGQSMDTGMRNLLMGQIAKLYKMPDLGKALETYQPEPDPYVEKMKELELMKLESEIQERLSRTEKNKVDVIAKQAKAQLDQARARDLGSSADLKDLDFTRMATGEAFKEEMTKKDHDRTTAAGLKIEDSLTKERLSAKRM